MMLHSIQGISARKGETTRAFVERYDAVVRLKNGIEKLQKLVDKEIQLRRRFEYNDKEKFMKNFGKKVVTAFVTIIMAAGVALGFAACNKKPQQHITPPSQQQTPGGQETPGEQTPGGEQQTPGGEEQPGGEQTGGEQPGGEQNPGGEQPGGEGQKPGPGGEQEQPGEQDISREEFETELANKLENYYNENVALMPSLNISNTEILAINAKDFTVYFSCERLNRATFGTVKIGSQQKLNSYRQLLSDMSFKKDGFTNLVSRITENGVPEDICAFALSQDEVQTKLAQEGVDPSDIIDYKVINTTEFNSLTSGIGTNVTMLIGDNIVTLSIGGHTGTCKTQREYLEKLQNGRLSFIENIEVTPFKELSIAEQANIASKMGMPVFEIPVSNEEDAAWYGGVWNLGDESKSIYVRPYVQPNLSPEL